MNKRLFSSLALAGTLAVTAPMLVYAQPGDSGQQTGSPVTAPQQGMRDGQGMHDGQGMRHGHGMQHHGHGMRGGEGGGWMGPYGTGKMLRGLDLTEAQRDKVFALRHDQAPKLREQGKVARDAYRQLRGLTLSDNYDQAKARELSERGAQAIAQMAQLRSQTDNEVYRLLTPEQKQKLADRVARAGERGHGKSRGGDRQGQKEAPAETRS